MPRDYKVYLDDILEAIAKIQRYTKGLSQVEFFSRDMVTDAVVRNLEVTGEAAKQVPDEIRLKYPEVEWKKIRGLQDILIRDYFGIDMEIIWDIIQTKLAALEKQVREILKE